MYYEISVETFDTIISMEKTFLHTKISLLVVPAIAPMPNDTIFIEYNKKNLSLRATIEQIPIPVFLIRVGNNSFA
jgi:hypothetical protein